MARRVTVRIYDNQIAGLFRLGGDVMDESHRAARRGKAIARKLSPKRSYRLRDSHGTSVYTTNRYGTRIVIYNTAPHAEFVAMGTKGPIMSKRIVVDRRSGNPRRKMLRLRRGGKRGRMYPTLFRHSVAGQAAQPWLEEAAIAITSEYQ